MKGEGRVSVYLDNCRTTPVAKEVVESMLPYFSKRFGHPYSIYSLGQEANEAVTSARESIARSINADPEEILFTSGGTESNDIAIRGIAYANKAKGNHIITTKIEHPSVLRICEELEKEGFKVDYLDVDKEGFMDPDKLRDAITEKTILVSLMHVNNEIGTIEPVERVGEILREQDRKIYYHVDAATSYTKVKVDVNKINADLVSLSAHKIHGPKGVGSLFVRKRTHLSPISYGYISMSRLRPGTENVPGIVGMAKAVDMAFEKFDFYVHHMMRLRDKLIQGIESNIPDVLLNGPRGSKRSPENVNFSFKYIEGESIMLHLDLLGVSVSTASACTSRKLEPSHVLTACGVPPEISHGSIRFCVSRYSTQKEIDYVLEVLPTVIMKLREISPVKSGW